MSGDPVCFAQAKRVDIKLVLAQRGLLAGFRLQGQRIVGPCPIHGGDNNGAFVVSRERNQWYCFTRCSRGGDVVELVARLDLVNRVEAARRLCRVDGGPSRSQTPRAAATSAGRSQPFRPFRRRLSLDPDCPFLRDKGIGPSTARRFDVGAWHGDGFLRRCVGVRLFDRLGQPLGYAGRRLDPGEQERWGKWKLPRGMPKRQLLYARHRIGPDPKVVVLTECPWGVLRLYEIGVPAVALMGIAMSPMQEQLLAAHPTGRSDARR